MPDDPSKPPRFPYIAALLCAACLGLAAWTWLRYSYAWDVTAAELLSEVRQGRSQTVNARYVACNGWPLDDPKEPKVTLLTLMLVGAIRKMSALPANTFSLWVPPTVDDELCSDMENGNQLPAVLLFEEEPHSGKIDWNQPAVVVICQGEPSVESLQGSLARSIGRAYASPKSRSVVLLADRSRLTGLSITGLVIGAMGVFVFSVALRHWLKERRAFREEAAGA